MNEALTELLHMKIDASETWKACDFCGQRIRLAQYRIDRDNENMHTNETKAKESRERRRRRRHVLLIPVIRIKKRTRRKWHDRHGSSSDMSQLLSSKRKKWTGIRLQIKQLWYPSDKQCFSFRSIHCYSLPSIFFCKASYRARHIIKHIEYWYQGRKNAGRSFPLTILLFLLKRRHNINMVR